ncbi:hypothetical protein E0L36_10870 [Streptomyces sp. AJS327]|uniref:hypothetical protein n=1 Tax=Streptomyces sp. AJS327 TaxID=2545265 RepID=UPI0015DFE7BB|nr:hypothetical protein [Streptomyces sp. AJS327]MBA0051372.1 hypothetical protein [Streptomyces sp. AJS327]
MLLADVVAEQELDRFATGTRWRVRVFDGPPRDRVLLAAEHEDVVRIGHDLGTVLRGPGAISVHDRPREAADETRAAGPGSVLLRWSRT